MRLVGRVSAGNFSRNDEGGGFHEISDAIIISNMAYIENTMASLSLQNVIEQKRVNSVIVDFFHYIDI